MPREAQLLASASKRLNRWSSACPGLQWRKRHGSPLGITGDPDLYGLFNGQHFEIELKRPGEQPTPLQSHRLIEWQKAGARVFVVHSLAELDDAINAIRTPRTPQK